MYQGYTAPDDRLIVVSEDHPHGGYEAGDKVEPLRVVNAHLRTIALERTASGRISANARKAAVELARRKGNKPSKQAAKQAAREALAAAGL